MSAAEMGAGRFTTNPIAPALRWPVMRTSDPAKFGSRSPGAATRNPGARWEADRSLAIPKYLRRPPVRRKGASPEEPRPLQPPAVHVFFGVVDPAGSP